MHRAELRQIGHYFVSQLVFVLLEVDLQRVVLVNSGNCETFDECLTQHLHSAVEVAFGVARVVPEETLVQLLEQSHSRLGCRPDELVQHKPLVKRQKSEVRKAEIEQNARVERRSVKRADLTRNRVHLPHFQLVYQHALNRLDDVRRHEHVEDEVDVGAVRVLQNLLVEELVEELFDRQLKRLGSTAVQTEVLI